MACTFCSFFCHTEVIITSRPDVIATALYIDRARARVHGIILISGRPCWCSTHVYETTSSMCFILLFYLMVHCVVVGCSTRSDRNKVGKFYRLPSIIFHQGQKTLQLTKEWQELWLSHIHRADLKPEQYQIIMYALSILYQVL